MVRAGIPTAMLFVQSLHGLSHNKIEDTREEHLTLAVQALDRLTDKTLAWMKSN
jgi:N-carbamoyl-L-amino-acid hydrolase